MGLPGTRFGSLMIIHHCCNLVIPMASRMLTCYLSHLKKIWRSGHTGKILYRQKLLRSFKVKLLIVLHYGSKSKERLLTWIKSENPFKWSKISRIIVCLSIRTWIVMKHFNPRLPTQITEINSGLAQGYAAACLNVLQVVLITIIGSSFQFRVSS